MARMQGVGITARRRGPPRRSFDAVLQARRCNQDGPSAAGEFRRGPDIFCLMNSPWWARRILRVEVLQSGCRAFARRREGRLADVAKDASGRAEIRRLHGVLQHRGRPNLCPGDRVEEEGRRRPLGTWRAGTAGPAAASPWCPSTVRRMMSLRMLELDPRRGKPVVAGDVPRSHEFRNKADSGFGSIELSLPRNS